MPQGGSLAVAVQANNAAGHACRVSVSDSGEGIPQPVLDRIFEPFATSKEHGTGLGLAISHRIAEEHGGTLLAANRAEGGAVFTLELPLTPAVPAHACAPRWPIVPSSGIGRHPCTTRQDAHG